MILHVYEAAKKANIGEVIVASPNQQIYELITSVKGICVKTRPDHKTGTDRIFEAYNKLEISDVEYIVNLQGDEPIIDCYDIKKLHKHKLILPWPYMNEGRVACHTSHLQVIKQFLDTDEDRCIIFEDDLQTKYDINELHNNGFLNIYPPLIDPKENAIVAQFEETILPVTDYEPFVSNILSTSTTSLNYTPPMPPGGKGYYKFLLDYYDGLEDKFKKIFPVFFNLY